MKTTLEERREARLRRQLKAEALLLRKSRVWNPTLHNQGGYRIVDPATNFALAGSDYELDLGDVEAWLREWLSED